MGIIAVKHNIEVAHRLFESLPGNKCENIHGHSMWVTLKVQAPMISGMIGGIDFGSMKKMFRGHLDEDYDHRLLLNMEDPFAGPIFQVRRKEDALQPVEDTEQQFLPGLQTTPYDPTTENIAEWIKNAMVIQMEEDSMYKHILNVTVEVWETAVNMVEVEEDVNFG
jgi:6-pyruvoyltetrahydropterin/6-carboxytetrahydropterin synthase